MQKLLLKKPLMPTCRISLKLAANIAGGIAFGAALDYMNAIGFESIAAYEQELLDHGTVQLKAIEGVEIYGEAEEKTALISLMSGDSSL